MIHAYISDGSSGYDQYRFRTEEGSSVPRQNNLLVSSLTVLRLDANFVENNVHNDSVLWENMLPNSPYSINPLRMKFEEESTGTYISRLTKKIKCYAYSIPDF